MSGPQGSSRRTPLLVGAVVLVVLLVVGVVVAVTLTRGGSSGDEAGGTPTGSPSTDGSADSDNSDEPDDSEEPEEVDTSAPPEGIEPGDIRSVYDLGEVCNREATIEGAQPFPAEVGQLSDLKALTVLQQPYADPPLRNRAEWVDMPTVTPAEANAGDVPAGGAVVNAVVCISAVEGTAEVRRVCEGTGTYAGQAWEVWSSDYVIRTIDPSSGAIVDESEPFTSKELPESPLQCVAPWPAFESDLRPDQRVTDMPVEVVLPLAADYFTSLVGG